MWLRKLVGERVRPRKFPRAATFLGLPSVKTFRTTLARERARADRYDGQFSLLCFAVNDARQDLPALRQIARILRRCLGSSDEAGWLGRQMIGVILPSAPRCKAWNVADQVRVGLSLDVPLPECRVSCYPSDWLLEDADTELRGGRQRSGRRLPADVMDRLLLPAMPRWKRGLDILGASLGLLLLWPIFLLVAVAIKSTSTGPVLFRQRRVGLRGKPFTMYKFRTMVNDAEQQQEKLMALNEQQGPVFKIRNDPRIAPLGQLLRTTSIDELPQLWNVLKGEMSLVGPRPPLDMEVQQYQAWERQRLDVTPGLTCTWQVQGRSKIAFTEWMRMDIRYVRSRSVLQDIGLLLRTVPAVLFRRGAS
jgi:lipopolysaccharide/colanic/teichoic acid biosynthesis glycosyltransferase